MNDEELLRRIARGGDEAMTQLMDRHGSRFLRFFERYLGDGSAAVVALLPAGVPRPATPAAWGLVNLSLGGVLGALTSLIALPLILQNRSRRLPAPMGEPS